MKTITLSIITALLSAFIASGTAQAQLDAKAQGELDQEIQASRAQSESWERRRQAATRQMEVENELARIQLEITLGTIGEMADRGEISRTEEIIRKARAKREVDQQCFDREQADRAAQIKSIRDQNKWADDELAAAKKKLAELERKQAELKK